MMTSALFIHLKILRLQVQELAVEGEEDLHLQQEEVPQEKVAVVVLEPLKVVQEVEEAQEQEHWSELVSEVVAARLRAEENVNLSKVDDKNLELLLAELKGRQVELVTSSDSWERQQTALAGELERRLHRISGWTLTIHHRLPGST